jgi:hypothetical protein
LLLVSLAASWALLELAVLPVIIYQAPLGRQANFTTAMQILAQDTKEELAPRDHLLLLGDSHAKGLGDWLLSADHSGHPPFHSAHVLRDELGVDVLSFGEGGASSIDALVRRPRQYTAALARFGLGAPERIVFYFYAGNDLQDNEKYLRRAIERGTSSGQVADADSFDEFLRGELARDLAWWRRWSMTLFTPQYVANLVASIGDYLRSAVGVTDAVDDLAVEGQSNRARVGGDEVWLPDRLGAPALELDDEAWSRGLLALDRSLASLREFYPEQPVLVAYIPSPISCYEIMSETVSVASAWSHEEVHSTEFLKRRAREMRRRVEEIVEAHGLEFVDLTPPLRKLAREGPVHGPRDWGHVNERGYRAIGRAVAERLRADRPGDGSDRGG